MKRENRFTQKTWKLIAQISLYGVLIFTVIISLFPLLWVLLSSMKENKAILGSPFTLPSSVNLKAFVYIFGKYNFGRYFLNSLYTAGISTLTALFIYAMAAYVMAKYRFKGRNLLYLLFTITLLVPVQAKAQPIFALILKLNLYDTLSGLALVYLSSGMALSLFILRAAFLTVPRSLDEAALINGAGFWQIFWKINIPLAKSGLATAGILMFLGNWNEFFYALILTSSGSKRTLPLALNFFTESFSYNYSNMFAALSVVVIPGILIYLLAREQVQKSIASSGIKG